ncbi:MAG: PH domain-containing protein [Balneolaceae bacterium]
MSEFQRQHPIAAVARAFALIKGNFITIIVLLVVGSRGGEGNVIWWIGGGFTVLLVLGIVSWWRFQYKIENGLVHIRRGLFVRQNMYLTRDRVQVIDVTAGVLQRMFGLVKVEIKTAASSSREASIDAISRVDAEIITEKLKNINNDSKAVEEQAESAVKIKKHHLPGTDLLIAASTSGSFGIALSIIGTIFSQAEPLISENEIYDWIINAVPTQSDFFLVVWIIGLLILFAWLMSFFGTLFTYGDFSLSVLDDRLIITRGIFEKKRITVPFNRIQALWVMEGILRQPFGYCSVHIESAGYGDAKGTGSIVLFPLIKKNKLESFLKETVPEFVIAAPAQNPPQRAIRRYVFRSLLAALPVLGGIYWLFDTSHWIWFLLIPAAFWGWLRYRDSAIGWDYDNILVSYRNLAKTTAFIKKKRAQDLDVQQSWLQKFRNLITVNLHVASGDHGRSFRVKELDLAVSDFLEKWVRKGENSRSQEMDDSWLKIIPEWKKSL